MDGSFGTHDKRTVHGVAGSTLRWKLGSVFGIMGNKDQRVKGVCYVSHRKRGTYSIMSAS